MCTRSGESYPKIVICPGANVNIAIIGCGLIGRKRAKFLAGCRLVACSDVIRDRAEAVASEHPGAVVASDWSEVIHARTVDLVVVATTHDKLAEITGAALSFGKHVLVEKPAARSSRELEHVVRLAEATGLRVHVGFNHRYHPALRKAREIVVAGLIGEPLYVRGRYGHGGRIGYEREWRADPSRSGGGELIDQGIHLIDLARWFLGDFVNVSGFAHTYFWKMPVEDNGFMLLRTAENRAAFLHASCTEWKNQFSFEIFGDAGKVEIAGLGGSYGVERITLYRMLPEMGPPETTMWEFPMPDRSWETELEEFLSEIRTGKEPAANLRDARAALKIVEEIYRGSGYDHNT